MNKNLEGERSEESANVSPGIRIELQPPFAHLYCFLPPTKHLIAFLLLHLGLEDCFALGIHHGEVVEALPHPDCETGCDGCAQGGGLAHGWSVDRDANEICLSLYILSVLLFRAGSAV